MSIVVVIAGVTARALLARRRALLMALLALVPVLIALLVRASGEVDASAGNASTVLEAFILPAILPLVALVFGTSALGAELEDGTAIHLLTKPVTRWRIVAGKVLAAWPATAVLVGISALLSGLVIGGGDGAAITTAYTLTVILGSLVYAALFVALSVLTSRALIVGLIYVVLWEGVLGGLFEGTRILSVRQQLLAIVALLDPVDGPSKVLATGVAVAGIVAFLVVSFVVATRRLEAHQLTVGD
jgi:ABC-2 type transport system permease protein